MYSLSQKTKCVTGALLLMTGISWADAIIQPTEKGQYYDTGLSNLPTIHQHGAGRGGTDSPISNNFFAFNLSGVSETVVSAELRIDSNWYFSSDPFETYTTYDVSTDLTSLMNGSGGVSAFNDLQTGNTYGSINISSADNGTTVSITLNPQAIQDINNNLGGLFAIGGTVSTLDAVPQKQEDIFPYTDPDSPFEGVELVLTTIPEAESAPLLLLGGMMLYFRKRLA